MLTPAERGEIARLFGYVPDHEPLQEMLDYVARLKERAWEDALGDGARRVLDGCLRGIEDAHEARCAAELDRRAAAIHEVREILFREYPEDGEPRETGMLYARRLDHIQDALDRYYDNDSKDEDDD